MKIFICLLFILPFSLFSQLTASLSVDVSACVGSSGQTITFTGSNGTQPYTFTYNINGGATQIVSTTSGNSVSVPISTVSSGTFNYNLVQVEDNLGASALVSDQAIATVNALPNVNAGPDQQICIGTSVTVTGSGGLTYTWDNGVTNGVPFTPASTITLTVMGIDLNGCVNTDQVTIIVNSLPLVSAGPDQTICNGTSVTLSGSGAISYTWNAGISNGVAFIPVATETYTVTGTSAAGCINMDQVVVTVEQLPIVDAGPDLNLCTGSSLVLSGTGASTYNWSPATGLSSTTSANPTATPGVTTTYTVTGESLLGCTGTDQITVTVLPTTPTPPTATIDSSYCNDGVIQLNSSQTGTSIIWQNGSTSPILSYLSPGTYIGTYTDANGCQMSVSYAVPLSALGGNCPQITGSVYMDYDNNCIISGSDNPIANRMIIANPGNYLTMTDQNGNYSFSLPIGTYTIQEQINSPSILSACTVSYTVPLVTISDSIGNINFMDTLAYPIDVYASFYTSIIVPGFNFIAIPQFYSLTPGISVQSLNAWFTIPPGVTLTSWTYPHIQSNDTLYFSLSDYGTGLFSTMSFTANTNLPLGSFVTFCAGIDTLPGELNIVNNIYCQSLLVMGAFDPNDKRMFLNGVQSDSTIYLTDQTLDYIIRFQNTGNAPAHNIYILDTINSTLDLNSFEYVTASHNCNVSIMEGNVLNFSFPQIMLPDSTNNEPESHGFVHYRIRQSNQNIVGTVINNTAYIYFDFNEPVVTNTTYDEIVIDDLGIVEEVAIQIKLYPNPTNGKITIECDKLIENLTILNSSGQIFQTLKINNISSDLDLSDLAKGIYFIKLDTSDGISIKRIILQ